MKKNIKDYIGTEAISTIKSLMQKHNISKDEI